MSLRDLVRRRPRSAAPATHANIRPGCTPIAEAQLGRMVRVCGDITSVVFRPETTVAALEAEIEDGSGRLRIVWLGRASIRGIEPGRGIISEGRVVRSGDMLLMNNPRYELMPRGNAE
mgnify:CR=1 FL=1